MKPKQLQQYGDLDYYVMPSLQLPAGWYVAHVTGCRVTKNMPYAFAVFHQHRLNRKTGARS